MIHTVCNFMQDKETSFQFIARLGIDQATSRNHHFVGLTVRIDFNLKQFWLKNSFS